MADPVYTLNYVDGASEQTLAAWGFADPLLTIASQNPSEFTVRVPGQNMAAAPPIPFEARVQLKKDGSVIFVGKQTTDRRQAQARTWDTLVFQDAWYDLQRIPFQHVWKYRDPISKTYLTTRFSRINLFQGYPSGGYLNAGQQIVEIVQWAIQCGAYLRVGVVDIDTELPIYPVKAIMCSEAIELCLKIVANAQTWIDNTVDPPTFNCRAEPNLAAVTFPFMSSAGGVSHRTTDLVPRYDLQPSQVVVDYQQTVTENDSLTGTTVAINLFTEAYPPGSTGQAVRALVLPVDLQSTVNNVSQKVTAAALPTTNPNWLTWFKLKKPELADGKVQGSFALSSGSVTVADEAGASIDTSHYKNEMTDGATASWMADSTGVAGTVDSKVAVISADFTWDEFTQATSGANHGAKVKTHKPTRIAVRCKVTNSPVGEVTYRTTVSSSAQSVPYQLPKKIWDSLSRLQYEGEHEVVEPFVSTIVGPWNVLNLSGGPAAWASMRACIQSARHDLYHGRTTISVGPAKHIAPSDLAEYLTFFRFRLVISDPQARVTGEASGGGNANDSAAKMPKENTTHGLEQPSYAATINEVIAVGSNRAGNAVFAQIVHDPSNTILRIEKVEKATGVRVSNASGGGDGACDMDLADTLGSDNIYHELYFQEIGICVPDGMGGFLDKKTIALMCDPY